MGRDMVELVACGGLSFALDQCSKRLAIERRPHDIILSSRQPRSSTRSVSGPASLLLIWMAALACAIVLARSGAWFQTDIARFGLAAAFGGAAGNLLDLVRRRAVVDFIDVGWWPAFNVADVAIVAGLVLAFSHA
jgi:lipoprotein signal peptidase